MNTPQTPDYGEPWNQDQRVEMHIKDRSGNGIASFGASWNNIEDPEKLHKRQQGLRDRTLACVNACAGMADPAAEIEAMREAIRDAHAIIERYSESAISHATQLMCPECLRIEAFDEEHKDSCAIGKALTKLKPFLKP